jgi:hypothetical protein
VMSLMASCAAMPPMTDATTCSSAAPSLAHGRTHTVGVGQRGRSKEGATRVS